MPKIGITTTVPLEIILAAGYAPVDLNNLFMSRDSLHLVHQAEIQGFPRNLCAWIKGIYSVALQEGISQMVAVTQGDCSNTQALIEMLSLEGVRVIPFAYPYDRDEELLRLQMERFLKSLGCSWESALAMKERLDAIRLKVHRIDRMTWDEGVVSGFENHYYQVSCSDMQGDPESFEAQVDQFLDEICTRERMPEKIRLGFIGVPPIFTDLYSLVESLEGRIVFNEVQRQFSMPACGQGEDLVEQYRRYTYPYDVFARIADIREQLAVRRIDGLIHYVQSFCFHRLEDLIVRKSINLPVLTLEGDNPGRIDARTRIRIESFLQVLKERKGA
ncbi:MAG: 2-hydroxyacyl-CoA dehydratase family protein [bacterium]